MISVETSRNGEPTLKIDNRYIHSKYSPLKEASDFYDNSNLERYSTFVLIEPGFNYLSDILIRQKPDAKIISIHFISDFMTEPLRKNESSYLYQDSAVELFRFLKSELSEFDLDGLKLLEWPPAANIFRDYCNSVNKVISQVVRELYGNITTVSGFGKRLFKNYVRNYLTNERFLEFRVSDNAPVVITGSGPGLSDNIVLLKKYREHFVLVALPSSVAFLKHYSIDPDIIITTDPGYFASLHLAGFSGTPVAAPLSAKLTADTLKNGFMPFSQNHFLDSSLFGRLHGFTTLPSNGTVAGSALYLATSITEGPVFLCGLDFSFIGSSSHVRPHSFDNLLESLTNRTQPLCSLLFKRNISVSERVSGDRRTTIQLKTYSGWFASVSRQFRSRVFFLNHFENPPGEFLSVGSDDFPGLINTEVSASIIEESDVSCGERKALVSELLSSLKNNLSELNGQIVNCQSAEDIFDLLNTEIIFNLYLPELLEFRKHFMSSSPEKAGCRAMEIIRKAEEYLEGVNV